MDKNNKVKKIFHRGVLLLLIIALGDFLFSVYLSRSGEQGFSLAGAVRDKAQEAVLNCWLPVFAFADGANLAPSGAYSRSVLQAGEEAGNNRVSSADGSQPAGEDNQQTGVLGNQLKGMLGNQLQGLLGSQLPYYAYTSRQEETGLQTESGITYDMILRLESQDEYTESMDGSELEVPGESEGKIRLDDETARLLMEENQPGQAEDTQNSQTPPEQVSGNQTPQGQQTAGGRVQEYNWSYYQDYDALIKEFYAVDATTQGDPEKLKLDQLLGKSLAISKNPDVPQILIYHTHSQEDFVNSVKGDASTTIMGAGEVLAQILRNQYGYNVIHHLGQYDVESRDYAYSNSLPEIEKLLQENPTIEVVIDLHRDEVLEGRKLVVDLNGKPTATFMFFNGLSYTREQGAIEYLNNPNLSDNLAFSFQMQVLANEYYPGLTRRIYLKGYRYNMHLKPRSLLIELGAQTNTVEEIMNACEPLARLLDLELSGAGEQ